MIKTANEVALEGREREKMNIDKELVSQVVINLTPPPEELYNRAKEKFGDVINWEKNTVFTYGTDIYTVRPLEEPLYRHEVLHVIQQMQMKGGPDAWWDKYFDDPEFRLSQELDAYRVQYLTAKKYIKDRNQLFRYLHDISVTLASDLYGNLLSTQEAMKLIKQ